MSPAMVDVRSSVTKSRIQSQRSPLLNPNPKKGQLSSSSSSTLVLGSPDYPVSELLKTETGPMGSPNQRNAAGFSTPPPPPPSGTKSEKPNLSKPRFMKLRRHLVPQRVEQSSRSGTESRVHLGSNTIDSSDGDGKVGEVQYKFQEWNPFSSVPGRSVGANSCPLEFGSSSGSSTFVFGANKASVSASSLSSKCVHVGESAQSLRDVESVRPGDGAGFSFGGNESGKVTSSLNLKSGASVDIMEKKLPDEIRKLKIDGQTNQATGSGASVDIMEENLPDEVMKLKIDGQTNQATGSSLGLKMNDSGFSETIQNFGSFDFGNSGADASFVFGANQSRGAWPSSNSMPNEKLRGKFSGETKSGGESTCSSTCNDIGNSGSKEGPVFTASQSTGVLKTVLTSSRTVEGPQNLSSMEFRSSSFNPEVVFPASQSSRVVNTADTMPRESAGRPFQDDLQKLNTRIGTNESGVEPNFGTSCSGFAKGYPNFGSSKVGKSAGDKGFIFGANQSSGLTSCGDKNNVFRESVGQYNQSDGAAPSSNLTPGGSNRVYEDTLPSEMKKLNIESEAKFVNKNDKSYSFVFGQKESSYSKTKSNSVEVLETSTGPSMEKTVQDELKKLNIRSKNAFQGKSEAGFTFTTDRRENMTPNFGTGFGAGVFVFGSRGGIDRDVSGKNSTVGFDEKKDIKLSNDMKKLSMEEVGNGPEEIEDKNIGATTKDTGSSVLGSGKDAAEESSTCKNSLKDTESGNFMNRPLGDSTFGHSIPTPFTFQAGRKANNLHVDDVPPVLPKVNAKSSETAAPSSSSSFSGPYFPSDTTPSEGTATYSSENKANFENLKQDLNVPVWDPQIPKHDASSFKENIYAGLHQNLVFSATKESKTMDSKSKKRRGKLKSRTGLVQQKHFVSREGSSQESSEMSSPGYSPMDFSPYQENLAADQFSRETSLGSDDTVRQSVGLDAQSDRNCGSLSEEGSKHGLPENGSVPFRNGMTEFSNEVDVSGAETCGSNIQRQAGVAEAMSDVSFQTEDSGGTNFTFAAFPSAQVPLSARKRHYRKKNWMKGVRDSYTSIPNTEVHLTSPSLQFSPFAASSVQAGPGQGQSHRKEDVFISQKEAGREPNVLQHSVSAAVAQEACEKWRIRGNQAYANGNLSKAEDCYTQGVNCISPKETSTSCVRAVMLCYSNRAATRMFLGRMREALQDCMMAASIEPNFLRVQLRAANCYLALGETEDALKHFKNCLPSGRDLSLDRKIVLEASDGLQKTKQVSKYMNQCTKLLEERTSDNAIKALELTAEALSISPYSECLIEMKAEALLMLRKYEDVVHLCEETMDSAEKNYNTTNSDFPYETVEGSERFKESPAMLWRCHLISKSYFYMGRLEEALDFLQKHETVESTKDTNKNLESSTAFAGTIQELLRHKAAGNEAFQAGKHLEAVEHYSAALSCSVESRPFAAICFCNRAAAYQALGQITDAIADCCLAIALDSNYPKAISRRATLHEMIRDYGQATSDLQRLLSLLEKQAEDKANQSRTLGRSSSGTNDIRQARARLATVEEEAKMGVPLDMYLILGIESSATAVEIKKAYRKAALRHHPDKAGQFLARSENGDDGLWKEVFDEVHKDADRLFKMIGEAYAVMSDPSKRLRYDAEEEIRNAQKKGGTPKSQVDVNNYPFEKSSSRRQWRDAWKTYGNPQQRWSEASRSHKY
ncbi:uncharacterized protein [Aristolochia californica]|uniref:uncharacterized protein n=1 Tax=Aristolochia californica TaxID=171875 RepID=UPI0035E0D683